MAGKNAAGGRVKGDAGDAVPHESVELDGNIVTAAKSTMIAKSYERGYPIPEGYIHMGGFELRRAKKS